jgi:hypothetical protein
MPGSVPGRKSGCCWTSLDGLTAGCRYSRISLGLLANALVAFEVPNPSRNTSYRIDAVLDPGEDTGARVSPR